VLVWRFVAVDTDRPLADGYRDITDATGHDNDLRSRDGH